MSTTQYLIVLLFKYSHLASDCPRCLLSGEAIQMKYFKLPWPEKHIFIVDFYNRVYYVRIQLYCVKDAKICHFQGNGPFIDFQLLKVSKLFIKESKWEWNAYLRCSLLLGWNPCLEYVSKIFGHGCLQYFISPLQY